MTGHKISGISMKLSRVARIAYRTALSYDLFSSRAFEVPLITSYDDSYRERKWKN